MSYKKHLMIGVVISFFAQSVSAALISTDGRSFPPDTSGVLVSAIVHELPKDGALIARGNAGWYNYNFKLPIGRFTFFFNNDGGDSCMDGFEMQNGSVLKIYNACMWSFYNFIYPQKGLITFIFHNIGHISFPDAFYKTHSELRIRVVSDLELQEHKLLSSTGTYVGADFWLLGGTISFPVLQSGSCQGRGDIVIRSDCVINMNFPTQFVPFSKEDTFSSCDFYEFCGRIILRSAIFTIYKVPKLGTIDFFGTNLTFLESGVLKYLMLNGGIYCYQSGVLTQLDHPLRNQTLHIADIDLVIHHLVFMDHLHERVYFDFSAVDEDAFEHSDSCIRKSIQKLTIKSMTGNNVLLELRGGNQSTQMVLPKHTHPEAVVKHSTFRGKVTYAKH